MSIIFFQFFQHSGCEIRIISNDRVDSLCVHIADLLLGIDGPCIDDDAGRLDFIDNVLF